MLASPLIEVAHRDIVPLRIFSGVLLLILIVGFVVLIKGIRKSQRIYEQNVMPGHYEPPKVLLWLATVLSALIAIFVLTFFLAL